MNEVTKTGLEGIQRGLSLASVDAAKLTASFIGDNELEPVESIINIQQDKRLVEASSKIVKVGYELDRVILDILA